MGEKVINAALLGLGTVGTGVYKVLKNQEEEMTAKIGCKVEITKILVSFTSIPSMERPLFLPQ